jgi:hypothetical protein
VKGDGKDHCIGAEFKAWREGYTKHGSRKIPPPCGPPSLTDIKIGPVNEPIASSRTKHLAPPPHATLFVIFLQYSTLLEIYNYILLFNFSTAGIYFSLPS